MRIRFPHPFVLLLGGVLVAALLTWILPAGQYERRIDPATGGEVVVAGTYKEVDASPVGPAQAVLAVPRGMVDGAEIIIVILLVGGAYALLDRTGALGRLVAALVGRSRSPVAVIAGVSAIFATLGALENMHEEIIALVPVLLVLSRGLGFGAITALAMSVGAAVVGGRRSGRRTRSRVASRCGTRNFPFSPSPPFASACCLLRRPCGSGGRCGRRSTMTSARTSDRSLANRPGIATA